MIVRKHPSPKWIRARKGEDTVVDSRRVLLVWRSPGRPYPSFAFPAEDVAPGVGEPISDLPGHVFVQWGSVDAWFEDDEPLLAHARDPFARIDVRRSSRHVVVEHRGERLAESRSPWLLYETGLPVRTYLPAEDVALDRLEASPTRTACAYKGHADQFRHGGVDVAWIYRDPLFDAPPVKGRIAFYDERVDVWVDGERMERPRTEFS